MTEVRHPWQERDRNAYRLAADFMKRFESYGLMTEARAGKWDGPLRKYAWDAARAQADIICGVKNWGYTNAVYQWGPVDPATTKARVTALEERCRQQAATGYIAVEVPAEAIEAWKLAHAA